MKATLLCLALIFLAGPCAAQENLVPEDAPIRAGRAPRAFGRDYGRALQPQVGKDVRVFAVIEGGLVPDFVVGLKTAKEGYRIFMIGERRGNGLERCESPIGQGLARDIILAWDKVLRQTRAPTSPPVGGADVPFFHFGSQRPSGLAMGWVLDTPPTSNPARLGRIASGLLQMCSGDRMQPVPDALADIRTALRAIH